MNRPPRVLIVDDDALVRGGLTMMLDGVHGITVVGEATDGDEVLAAADAHSPDVVLMDLRMPRVDGITATRRLRARTPPPEVVVLTTFDTDENILYALRAGASGFLLKDTPPRTDRGRGPAGGRRGAHPVRVHHPAPDGAHRRPGRRLPACTHVPGPAQPREHEVALAVARGHSNAEIAAQLYMSVAAVKAHVSNALTKLDLGNRTQIALLAHDVGLT